MTTVYAGEGTATPQFETWGREGAKLTCIVAEIANQNSEGNF